jgi:hypothetical protein
MSLTSEDYFARLTSGIDPNHVTEWERQMVAAEQQRVHDRSVMDVVGSISVPDASPVAPNSETTLSSDITSEWLQLALVVEEKQ